MNDLFQKIDESQSQTTSLSGLTSRKTNARAKTISYSKKLNEKRTFAYETLLKWSKINLKSDNFQFETNKNYNMEDIELKLYFKFMTENILHWILTNS